MINNVVSQLIKPTVIRKSSRGTFKAKAAKIIKIFQPRFHSHCQKMKSEFYEIFY